MLRGGRWSNRAQNCFPPRKSRLRLVPLLGKEAMGMFDHFEPVPPIEVDGVVLSGWQGKAGPCALYIWRQGKASPIEHAVDQEWKEKPAVVAGIRLPEGESLIYTTHPNDKRWINAAILVRNGTWVETRLRANEEA